MTPQNWRLKRSPGFSGKNRGVTPSVAAPGVTHPSDATAYSPYDLLRKIAAYVDDRNKALKRTVNAI